MKLSEFGKSDKQKSILDELNEYALDKGDKDNVFEERAQHVIQSAINFMSMIEDQYDEKLAESLKRKMINSIKSGNYSKFSNTVKRIKESRDV